MKPRDLAIYLFLALAWGLSFLVVVKVVDAFGFVAATSIRGFIACGTLFAIAKLTHRHLDFSDGWQPFLVVGATTVAGQLLGLSYAIPMIGTAMAAILVASIPLFSMVISQVWGLERMKASGLTGLALGVAGIVLLVGFPAVPVTSEFVFGCAAALAACFSAAFGSNYAAHKLKHTGSWEVTIGSFLFGGLISAPFLFAVPVPRVPEALDILYLLISACVMSATTYVLYFKLVGSIGATKAISVEFAVTVVAVFVGAIVLDEPLSSIQIVGAAVIILGCALVLGLFPWQRSKVAAVPLPHQDGVP
ncbi:DMT family transporter [Neorhizobium sp. JUb45]|uniref:DMT family transporter n=1 Tax=unclassified Neorhizobium TaxID=2629175 RepID=UPI0010478187|nr:DMT family transporter [Neorhizobium sp. JUb45]TCR06708.1 drug/metabolite transporter (DMT)-like permease [Neorhizobium sp. JUb45]